MTRRSAGAAVRRAARRAARRAGSVWLAAVGLCFACASEGFPPGGPEDRAPPVLVESEPADRAVNATPDQAIRLRFDEPIDDRQLRELEALIVVNPDSPTFDIQLDEDRVTLVPGAPLRTGMTYTVTLRPGLQDREGNRTTQSRTILFAVGGEQPITLSLVRATIVRDTVPSALARLHLEDDAADLEYNAVADSQGLVTLEAVAYGSYVATVWEEKVRPEGWQMTEEPGTRDTFVLSPEQRSHEATYRLAVMDTTAPLIARVTMPESRRLLAGFDDELAADAPLTAQMVRLYEGAPELRSRGAPLDALPLTDVRARRLAIDTVERSAPAELVITPTEPLRAGRIYRIEIVGVGNASGRPSRPEGGLTFLAEYEGPAVFIAQPVPWPP
ncbi:MAG: Ig-like domain-containing protein [Gemmatimonadota bacterium]